TADALGVRSHILDLVAAGEWTHAHAFDARIADLHSGEAARERAHDVLHYALVDEGAADRRALLPRLHRHLPRHFLDEEIELLGARSRVRTKHREVEGVGFLIEAHVLARDDLVLLEHKARGRRARESDGALRVELVEQVAGA